MADNDVLTEESILQLVNELIAVEAAAREASDTQEAQNRQYGDDLLGQLIAQETAERETALRGLQSSVNQSITRIDGNVTQLQNLLNSRLDITNNNISNINASFTEKMALLESLRTIILDNQSKVGVLTGDETVVGSVSKALFDAKAYTDSKISEVLDGAPELLDTLKELANSLGNDASFITTVNTSIQEVRDTAAANKQEILSLLSQSMIKKFKVVLTQQHIDDGYVDLPHIGIIHGSLDAHMDRLGMFEGEDFTLHEVGLRTRLLFINNFEAGGDEEVEVGAELRVKYWTIGD